MAFDVCHMTFPGDLSKMDDFVYTIFLPDMPLMRIFNIDTNPTLPHRLPSPHPPSHHPQDIYLKAVDSGGDMIGIAISKEHVVFATDSNTQKGWSQMVEFFEFVEEASHLEKLPGRTIELLVISVRGDWRNHGVARRLAEDSAKLARVAGFTTMKVCCANDFTAKLARGLGWREHYRLAYKDYARLSGADISLTPFPPHDNFYIYVTGL